MKKKKTMFLLSLSPLEHDNLRSIAFVQRKTMARVLREAINEQFKKLKYERIN